MESLVEFKLVGMLCRKSHDSGGSGGQANKNREVSGPGIFAQLDT